MNGSLLFDRILLISNIISYLLVEVEVIYIVKAHQLVIQPDYIVPTNQEKQLGSSHTGQTRHDDALA